MSTQQRIAVLGGGAWGTALAATMVRAGHDPVLWARDPEIVESLNTTRQNPRYLPGIGLDAALTATDDLDKALSDATCILAVVPAQSTRKLLVSLRDRVGEGVPVVVCAKGIESTTGKLLSEITAELLPSNPPAALSGPSFAVDVARGLPTAVTVAAANSDLAVRLAVLLSAPAFRCYSTDDITGVEIGGALKNVLAIAAGAVAGAGLGASAQAAMVTRGFVEMRRIAAAFGARPETLMGLSGLGDLILTCGSAQSRNFSYGQALGAGEDLANRPLAEGVATAGIAGKLARRHGIDAPIVEVVSAVLGRKVTVLEAVDALLSRPLKSENV